MGLFDLPAPLFAWTDQLLSGFASPTLRLVFWGLVAAAVSMGFYWLFSAQDKLTDIKQRALKARKDLNSFDGAFEDAWPLMRSMLGLSFRQLGLTTLPAILASIPVVALIVWVSTAYGYRLPADGADVLVQTVPERAVSADYQASDPAAPANYPRLVVTGEGGDVIGNIALAAPVPTIHKKQWWNMLIGNPLGYLPAEAPVDAIQISLPEREYLNVGPTWLRPWYVLFFATLVLGSIIIKMAFRIT